MTDGGPAFPVSDPPYDDGSGYLQCGMSLRDWFAGMALNGCLSYSLINPSNGNYHENCDPNGAAESAYKYADAMLHQRQKT